MAKPDLTPERLRELLHYNPETGVFTWLVSLRGHVKTGDKAGYRAAIGYIKIKIGGTLFYGHRLAWLYEHGVWPRHGLDHRDGDKSNNKLSNLREATQAENLQNVSISKRNTSGFLGVYFRKDTKKHWVAQMAINGKVTGLGFYSTAAEASAAYLQAKARFHTFNPVPR